MIQAMKDQWQKADRPSSISSPARPKTWSEMTREDLVMEIQSLRADNKILEAKYDMSRRWMEEFASHSPECLRHVGSRCSCGLSIFIVD